MHRILFASAWRALCRNSLARIICILYRRSRRFGRCMWYLMAKLWLERMRKLKIMREKKRYLPNICPMCPNVFVLRGNGSLAPACRGSEDTFSQVGWRTQSAALVCRCVREGSNNVNCSGKPLTWHVLWIAAWTLKQCVRNHDCSCLQLLLVPPPLMHSRRQGFTGPGKDHLHRNWELDELVWFHLGKTLRQKRAYKSASQRLCLPFLR